MNIALPSYDRARRQVAAALGSLLSVVLSLLPTSAEALYPTKICPKAADFYGLITVTNSAPVGDIFLGSNLARCYQVTVLNTAYGNPAFDFLCPFVRNDVEGGPLHTPEEYYYKDFISSPGQAFSAVLDTLPYKLGSYTVKIARTYALRPSMQPVAKDSSGTIVYTDNGDNSEGIFAAGDAYPSFPNCSDLPSIGNAIIKTEESINNRLPKITTDDALQSESFSTFWGEPR